MTCAEDLDEIGFCAWIAQAEPGAALIYHQGFLSVDVTALLSSLPCDERRRLGDLALAAWRAGEQGLVHLVQDRLGPDRFAYLAIARPKPITSNKPVVEQLLEAA